MTSTATGWRRDGDAWVIDLPVELQSGNKRIVNGHDRVTAAIYRRARDRMARDLRLLSGGSDAPPSPTSVSDYGSRTPRREVLFTRIMGKGQRPWDDDNLAAALKYVRDAMQMARRVGKRTIWGAGIIVDDSAKWAHFPPALQERSVDGRPGLRIRVRDLELTL